MKTKSNSMPHMIIFLKKIVELVADLSLNQVLQSKKIQWYGQINREFSKYFLGSNLMQLSLLKKEKLKSIPKLSSLKTKPDIFKSK